MLALCFAVMCFLNLIELYIFSWQQWHYKISSFLAGCVLDVIFLLELIDRFYCVLQYLQQQKTASSPALCILSLSRKMAKITYFGFSYTICKMLNISTFGGGGEGSVVFGELFFGLLFFSFFFRNKNVELQRTPTNIKFYILFNPTDIKFYYIFFLFL